MKKTKNIFTRQLMTFLAILLFSLPSYAESEAVSEAGVDEVKKIAELYIKATYEGDAETLKKIFHESASMHGYLKGELGMGGPAPFIEQMGSNPSLKSGGAPYEATIENIHVNGKIGNVIINETGFGDMSFTNYLNLLEQNGEWKIVNKTYYSY